MIERHGILLWVDGILNAILETEVGASIGVTFEKTILDTFPKVQQNLGDLVSPPVIGYVVGYCIEHCLQISYMQLITQARLWKHGKMVKCGLSYASHRFAQELRHTEYAYYDVIELLVVCRCQSLPLDIWQAVGLATQSHAENQFCT